MCARGGGLFEKSPPPLALPSPRNLNQTLYKCDKRQRLYLRRERVREKYLGRAEKCYEYAARVLQNARKRAIIKWYG